MCVVLAGLCTFALYLLAPKPKYPTKTLFLLSGLRFIATFIISWLLLGPMVSYFSATIVKPTIVIAQDYSKSMAAGPDSMKTATQIAAKIQELKSQLQHTYEVKYLGFGEQITTDTAAINTHNQTNMGQMLDHVYNQMALSHMAGLVVVSDGAFNQGVNPAYFNYNRSFPIYTIGVGDTTAIADMAIDRVQHNELVYAGNSFFIKVFLSAEGLKGSTAALTVEHQGKQISVQKINVNQEVFHQEVKFEIPADSQGIQLYTVKLNGATRDANPTNNTLTFLVDVVASREKILLLMTGAHPDIAAIKGAIESEDKEVVVQKISEFNGNSEPYNMVIAHGFGNGKHSRKWKALWDGNTPLWAIIPSYTDVNSANQVQTSLRFANQNTRKVEKSKALVNKQFTLFNLDSLLVDFMNNASSLSVNQAAVDAQIGVKVLANQQRGMVATSFPLWVFEERGVNNIPTSILAADGLWKWKMWNYRTTSHTNEFDALLQKTVQLTTAKKDKNRLRLQLEKKYWSHERVQVWAEFFNKALEPVTDAVIKVSISGADGFELVRDFNWQESKYEVDFNELPEGSYKLTARTNYNGESFVKSANFAVVKLQLEQANGTANWQVLEKMASLTNGRFHTLKAPLALVNELTGQNQIPNQIQTVEQKRLVLSNLYLLLTVLGLLCTEWAVRKYGQS